jgi:anthranilate phosphoribosyltransferase
LTRSVIWNGGFYLWRSGAVSTLSDGFQKAQILLETGKVHGKREQVREAIATVLNHQLSTV